MTMYKTFFKDETGTTAIEYALIGSLIAVVVVGVKTSVGSSTTVSRKNVTGIFQAASGKRTITVDKIVTGRIDKDNSQ